MFTKVCKCIGRGTIVQKEQGCNWQLNKEKEVQKSIAKWKAANPPPPHFCSLNIPGLQSLSFTPGKVPSASCWPF